AHLADDDDVGVLAEALHDPLLEGVHVLAHLAVADDALLRGVHVLDRLRDQDDVAVEALVVRVDDGVERGALTGAGDTGDEGEPVADVLEHQPLLDDGVEANAVERAKLVGDGAHTEAEVEIIEVERGAETERLALTAQLIGEVDGAVLEELLLLSLAGHVEQDDVD